MRTAAKCKYGNVRIGWSCSNRNMYLMRTKTKKTNEKNGSNPFNGLPLTRAQPSNRVCVGEREKKRKSREALEAEKKRLELETIESREAKRDIRDC